MAIEQISEQAFAGKLGENRVTLVDFTSPYCPPCRALLPILESLDGEYAGRQLSIVKVDIDESPDIAATFGIMGTPTVLVFVDGQPMEKLVGLRPKSAYETVVKRYLS